MVRPHRHSDIDIEQLPVIELTDQEQKIVYFIAQLRNLTYRDISGGEVHGDQSSVQAHLTGTRGEFAVSKFFDELSPYDIDVFLPFGDGGEDFSVRKSTVDVKSTATGMDVPDLLVPEKPTPQADLYILAHVLDERRVRLVGMASRDTVLNHPVRRAPGDRRNHWVPPTDLTLFTPRD